MKERKERRRRRKRKKSGRPRGRGGRAEELIQEESRLKKRKGRKVKVAWEMLGCEEEQGGVVRKRKEKKRKVKERKKKERIRRREE
jgi:hypothetical protein